MSVEVLLRGLCSFIMALALIYSIYSRHELETGSALEEEQRYTPYLPALLLPAFFFLLLAAGLLVSDPPTTARLMLSMCFSIFLHISVYYVVLLLALPLLRRHISARVCATLWLLPSYLYFTQQSFMELPKPLLVLHAPAGAVWLACGVWAAGFAGVLLWKLASHLRFRRRILRPSREVTDRAVLDLWQDEQRAAGFKKANYRLVYSPAVQTPLSIGFFRRSIRVVLPERAYAPDELKLIFRHEIVHIGRDDSSTKFFLVFCTAMCWFNPLMWLAMRRSADDLELSCDETVLLDAGEETRRQYAELLLRTAGDERGFTTCLSASAEALRYRLKNIVQPRRRHVGGITAGLIFFTLIMSCGYVALAYGEGTGREYIFGGRELPAYTAETISRHDADGYRFYVCTDEATLGEYLAGLRFYEITGSYSFPEEENELSVIYYGPEGAFGVTLGDHSLKLTPLHGERVTATYYYHEGTVDWDYLYSLLAEEAGAPSRQVMGQLSAPN